MRFQFHRVLLVPAFLFLAAATTPQNVTTRPAAKAHAPVATQKTKGFIWVATSKTTRVYLLGSIHLATPDMYPLSPDIEAAFKASPTLVVELNINKVDQLSMLGLVTQLGMYTNGDTLSEHATPEVMQALTDFCQKNDLSDSMFETMKPWLAAVTLTELAVQKAGLDPSLGIDKHFLDESDGKKIIELETADSQIKTLAGFTDKQQGEWLKMTTEELKDLPKDIDKMVKNWKAGDTEAMKSLLFKDHPDAPDDKVINAKLIDDRNVPMTAQIDKLLKGKDPAFVVVGAAHLIGDKGIIHLLQAKGYKVEQISLTPPTAATQPAK